ncbi:MAG: histidine phosphatase family protein, partial [Bdellovibrionales bacterium]|nr:histidine phosphatase family protein [Bdellovibrionales bacterium]
MKIILFRHAIAEERLVWARQSRDENARPLTELGIAKLHQACKGFKSLVDHVDAIVSSSLVRAQQTAEILFEYYPEAELGEDPDLEPGGDIDSLVERLAESNEDAVIILVGHEPDL